MNNTGNSSYFGRDLEAMSFAKNYHEWILDEFKPYIGQNVAEVGAGTGNFSELLLEHVEQLVAFEPSGNMYPVLSARFAKNSKVETINSTFGRECASFEGCFDSVVYVNVLEHIENDEQELSYVHRTLRPGGRALIFVPALPFLYSELDKSVGHFRRYYKKGLIELAQDAGFKVARARYFDFAGIVPWYVTFVLLKKAITGTKVSLYDKLAVPLMRKVERFIAPPVGKNLLLVVYKT